MLIYGTAINRKDKLRDVLVHTVFQIMGMAKIVERASFHRRSSSGLRTARETEDETRRGGVRKEKKEKQKKTKKKEKEQFVFRAMAAFRAVHIIYVLTSFNFTDYRITRKL